MEIDRPKNFTFFDFVGGVQLLQGEYTKTVIPVILTGICATGIIGNILILLIFILDFKNGKGSEVKALLVSLSSTDLAILMLCAPVRAVTYYRETWTLGHFVCRTTDWFQHLCLVAKTLILAASSRTRHNLVPNTSKGPFFNPTRIQLILLLVFILSMIFPIPQMLYASLKPHGESSICISEMPVCASEFMHAFYKIYPTLTFVAPIIFAIAYHTKTLHSAVNHNPNPDQQSKVTLVLLCVSGANALMLMPQWGTFTWIRMGFNKPPVGFVIFAQVLLYACSAFSPIIFLTMYDDVHQGMSTLWFRVTCRRSKHVTTNRAPKTEGNGAELGAMVINSKTDLECDASSSVPAVHYDTTGKTFPDVEHFWKDRRNTGVEEEQNPGNDPIPWEQKEPIML
ncbi:G-protein coupled receptor 151 [Aplochiton taeniatus]